VDKFVSPNNFRLWAYSLSHSQLLIRSGRNEKDSDSSNVDLIFGGVFYIELKSIIFKGIEITTVTPGQLDSIRIRRGLTRGHRWDKEGNYQDDKNNYYVLCSGSRRHFIGATSMHVKENKVDWALSSLDFPGSLLLKGE